MRSAAKPNRKDVIRWILGHGLRRWPWVLLGALGAVGNASTAAAAPYFFGQAVDLVRGAKPDQHLLLLYVFAIAGSSLLRVVLQFLRGASFEIMAQKIERDVRGELFRSLLDKSMTFHSLQPVGETMARATGDVRQINFFFSPGVNWVLGSVVFLFVPLFLAPRYHWQLTLTPALFILLYIVVMRVYMRMLNPATEATRRTSGELTNRLSETLDGIELVKGSSREEHECQQFSLVSRAFRNAFVRQGDIEAVFLPMVLFFLATTGGLLHALLLARNGELEPGQVIGYFGILLLLDFPTFASMFAYSRLATGVSAGSRILELIRREADISSPADGYAGTLQGRIEFQNVSFSYSDGSPVLKDVSFAVEAGKTIAVVGQTGSGKTTLAKLVNRIHDVESGRVLVDGVDVRDWNLENLRRNVSMIEQDVFLFSRSLAENIAFGQPEATPEEIAKAAQAAQADDFIREFADGYETMVGERGVSLSGGQRQRLALARAFLTNPGILILDDSTSAVDSETEDRIQAAITAAARGRTTLIITHRLAQIRKADLILVLRKGRLAAVGTHEELLESTPAYRRIFSQ